MKKILIGLTTFLNENWRKSIEDLSRFGIKEIGIFPTVLEKKEREEMYGLLEKSSVERIPHVHLRDGMDLAEAEFLIGKFKTEVFNIHPAANKCPSTEDYGHLKEKIYIENVDVIPTEGELGEFGGLCIDFTHWASAEFFKLSAYASLSSLADKYKIGCAHISAFGPKRDNPSIWKDQHYMHGLEELDYMKKYKKYLPDIASLELTNTIEELISAKKYLENILEL